MTKEERLAMFSQYGAPFLQIKGAYSSLIQNLLNVHLSNKTNQDPIMADDINFLQKIVTEKIDPLIKTIDDKLNEINGANNIDKKENENSPQIIQFPLPDQNTPEGKKQLARLLFKRHQYHLDENDETVIDDFDNN